MIKQRASHCSLFSCQASTDWWTTPLSLPTTADWGRPRPNTAPTGQRSYIILAFDTRGMLSYFFNMKNNGLLRGIHTWLSTICLLLAFVQQRLLSGGHLPWPPGDTGVVHRGLVKTLLCDVTDGRQVSYGIAGHFLGRGGAGTWKQRTSQQKSPQKIKRTSEQESPKQIISEQYLKIYRQHGISSCCRINMYYILKGYFQFSSLDFLGFEWINIMIVR